MNKLSDKNPCDTCTVDRQIGNPYRWQCECDRCQKPYNWKNECVKKLKEYEEIGTVEECRAAMERQRAKKPTFEINFGDYTSRFICECGKRIVVKHDSGVMDNHNAPNYCPDCGQRLDWGNEEWPT